MNRDQQERLKIKELVMKMTGAEMIEAFVRMNAIRELTADEARTSISAIARHAFAAGMSSITDNPNPTYSPQERLDDWFNKTRNRSSN